MESNPSVLLITKLSKFSAQAKSMSCLSSHRCSARLFPSKGYGHIQLESGAKLQPEGLSLLYAEHAHSMQTLQSLTAGVPAGENAT